jgi:hypothetical protein
MVLSWCATSLYSGSSLQIAAGAPVRARQPASHEHGLYFFTGDNYLPANAAPSNSGEAITDRNLEAHLLFAVICTPLSTAYGHPQQHTPTKR